MDWSHELLADRGRQLFARLSVFSGGFDLEAATAVCAGGAIAPGQILDEIQGLVDKSLLAVERRAGATILRAADPRFEFTDPPLRHSLPMAVTFAATASRPTAFLTGPTVIAGPPPGVIRLPRPAGAGDMARVSIAGHPLTATAALIWNGDLPRPLQRILFDTADGLTGPAPASLSPAG